VARPRLRSALFAGAVLATTVPLFALADSPALRCGVKQVGYWERLPVDEFKAVSGLASPNRVTGYTVDEKSPQSLAATNGTRIQTTGDHGCSWQDSFVLSPGINSTQSFVGTTSKVVALALLQRNRVAAVVEGAGSAARPHVLVQSSGTGWTTADIGLPAAGTPQLLRAANDGRTVYLTISPSGTGGGGGGTTGVLGGLPTGGGTLPGQTGLLYKSSDAGHSWALATTAVDLPTGGTGFSALDIDAANPNRLYGIVSGHLAVSADGGASFSTTTEDDFTALTSMGPAKVAAFRSAGQVFYSNTAGADFKHYPAPSGVTSAAYRNGDSSVLLERSGTLSRFGVLSNRLDAAPAGITPNTGSALGDRSDQASFHLLAGNTVLRYVDPIPPGVTDPVLAVGDTSVPPPNPGAIVPAIRAVTLPVGQSGVEDFTLNLPKNPTPLDLYFMIDVSPSMTAYISNVKANISSIVSALERQKVDLKVGVATMGTGPGDGENPWPKTYVYPPTTDPNNPLAVRSGKKYVKPTLYKRIRAVGATGAGLQSTINEVQVETDPGDVGPPEAREGVLLALRAAAKGTGFHTQDEARTGVSTYSEIKPGFDAGFRGSKAVRRVIVLATDEEFDSPYPQTHKAGDNLSPDFGPAIAALNQERIQVIGLSAGQPESLDDLRRISRGTRTFAPPGGVLCDDGRISGLQEQIPTGAPMVCNNGDHFSDAIIRLLESLVDRQSVALVPVTQSPVLGALRGSALLGLDVKKPNSASFQVNVSCVNVKPGRYTARFATTLRGFKVGEAAIVVTCVKALAVVPPKIIPPAAQPPGQPPAAQPPAAPPAPVAPPAPAVQVQPQVQPQVQGQVQIQPLSAGALQEQQELQLVLALNSAGMVADSETGFQPGQQLAMVDRRKRQEVQALGVLAFAITISAGVGLARLRARPEPEVRRAR
jgi:hypothetical protein